MTKTSIKNKRLKTRDKAQSTTPDNHANTGQPAPPHLLKKNHSNNLINKIKNSDTTKNYDKDNRNSQNQNKDPKSTGPNSNPYDSENPRKESESDSKDITEKDIQKDLIDNYPSRGVKLIRIPKRATSLKAHPLKPPSPKRIIPRIRNSKLGSLKMRNLKKMNSYVRLLSKPCF